MAKRPDLVLSRPIVSDFTPDVPIKYVEDSMASMFTRKMPVLEAGNMVVHLYNLWTDGMTRVMANYLQEWE